MKHAEKADFGRQMLRIGGDCLQGLAGGAEENVVHLLLVLIGDSRHGFWQRTPAQRLGYSSLVHPAVSAFPERGYRVGLRIVRFEACSAFTHVAACTLALSPIRDTLIEGFSHFVTSMTAPIASGWSESPGGAYTH